MKKSYLLIALTASLLGASPVHAQSDTDALQRLVKTIKNESQTEQLSVPQPAKGMDAAPVTAYENVDTTATENTHGRKHMLETAAAVKNAVSPPLHFQTQLTQLQAVLADIELSEDDPVPDVSVPESASEPQPSGSKPLPVMESSYTSVTGAEDTDVKHQSVKNILKEAFPQVYKKDLQEEKPHP